VLSALDQQIIEQNSKISGLESQLSEVQSSIISSNVSSDITSSANTSANTESKPTNAIPYSGPKVCYLTFDDGPSDNTLQILDILNRYNVKATFFVINTSHIDYVKQIYANGNTVGLHSNTHDYASVYSSDEGYFADLNAISDKVAEQIDIRPTIIRFPGGSSNTVSKKYSLGIMTRLAQEVTEKEYTYFDWNVSSGDAAANNVESDTIVENIKSQSRGMKRICVLMHDSLAISTTVAALPQIIEYLIGDGYSLEAINQDTLPFHHRIAN